MLYQPISKIWLYDSAFLLLGRFYKTSRWTSSGTSLCIASLQHLRRHLGTCEYSYVIITISIISDTHFRLTESNPILNFNQLENARRAIFLLFEISFSFSAVRTFDPGQFNCTTYPNTTTHGVILGLIMVIGEGNTKYGGAGWW